MIVGLGDAEKSSDEKMERHIKFWNAPAFAGAASRRQGMRPSEVRPALRRPRIAECSKDDGEIMR